MPLSPSALARKGLFMVYYAAIFERGREEPVSTRTLDDR